VKCTGLWVIFSSGGGIWRNRNGKGSLITKVNSLAADRRVPQGYRIKFIRPVPVFIFSVPQGKQINGQIKTNALPPVAVNDPVSCPKNYLIFSIVLYSSPLSPLK
jgi:hypothetical protein